jgi:hypothetical protein
VAGVIMWVHVYGSDCVDGETTLQAWDAFMVQQLSFDFSFTDLDVAYPDLL